MQLQYLGTAAAEGWPSLFCECESCRKARALGGKNIRTRSQAMVDGDLLLDFPPDSYLHALRYDLDLTRIHHLLITHSHPDHFYPDELMLRAAPYAHLERGNLLTVHCGKTVAEKLRAAIAVADAPELPDFLHVHEAEPFVPFEAGRHRVVPLLADHMKEETCLLYAVETSENGKVRRLLYAHDTWYFPEATWKQIEGLRFDAVSLDCTLGLEKSTGGHMGIPNVLKVRERMLRCGCADASTRFIVNHFSHNAHMTQEEMEEAVAPYHILVASDGLTVSF